jgi:ABC-type phosphate transport system permease subunit
MQVSKLAMVLFAQIRPINALAIAIRSLAGIYPSVAVTPAIDQRWSKQDVLTLVGVCVGVVTVVIGLVGVLVASPKTREWLCRPFDWFTQCVQPSKDLSLFDLSQERNYKG